MERVETVLKLRDELVTDVDRLHGVVVAASREPECVELWFVLAGAWQDGVRFHYGMVEGRSVSLDHRLREVVAEVSPRKLTLKERHEHLAILSRWFYSSWRQGEWVPFADLKGFPFRKVVNAIHRVAKGLQKPEGS
jgi:hypothetical protein